MLSWTRIRIRVSNFTLWRSNQLSHPDDALSEARILFLLDPPYPPDQHQCHLSAMEKNAYAGITLIRGFYVYDTYRQVLTEKTKFPLENEFIYITGSAYFMPDVKSDHLRVLYKQDLHNKFLYICCDNSNIMLVIRIIFVSCAMSWLLKANIYVIRNAVPVSSLFKFSDKFTSMYYQLFLFGCQGEEIMGQAPSSPATF